MENILFEKNVLFDIMSKRMRFRNLKKIPYVILPYEIRKEFGRGRVKVHVTFDGGPYAGSIVNMGVRNADGSICCIIGFRKDIRSQIGKQPGDKVVVTVREREQGSSDCCLSGKWLL